MFGTSRKSSPLDTQTEPSWGQHFDPSPIWSNKYSTCLIPLPYFWLTHKLNKQWMSLRPITRWRSMFIPSGNLTGVTTSTGNMKSLKIYISSDTPQELWIECFIDWFNNSQTGQMNQFYEIEGSGWDDQYPHTYIHIYHSLYDWLGADKFLPY